MSFFLYIFFIADCNSKRKYWREEETIILYLLPCTTVRLKDKDIGSGTLL
jgi:hypothetical protein